MLNAQSSMRNYLTLFFSVLMLQLSAQNFPHSIHYEQNEFYHQFGDKTPAFYDSINGFKEERKIMVKSNCQLNRIVFGFHPYWAGSDYLNYRWNLLSDFCYFSYEVDPSTGDPLTIHNWLTDPAIDSAQANGTRVHLCATLFSGHTTFFSNLAARQNLIDNLISLVQQRNADGINMDIEALPSSVSDSLTVFMQDLSVQLKAAIPGAFLSIDLPAVDWNSDFQINPLSNYVDWFFIMGYDYYWNNSDQAGPVSPLFTMVSDYNQSLSRTISAYETAGISPGKFILGIPYYGRQWKTESESIPSATIGSGTALTYSVVRNNNSIYNSSNYNWEANSFSSCYIFFQNDNWNQCFIGLERDLRMKDDIVNYRNLAGIGIWALGYDDGYNDLWQAISDKFTDCYIPLEADTIFDSGGPTWNYYGNENYTMTIDHGFNDTRYLTFTAFNLEETFDSLWLYAGPDTTFPFLGGFSGMNVPATLSSANGAFTLKFKSDGIYNFSGWNAVFHDGSMGEEENYSDRKIHAFPNPTAGPVTVVKDDDLLLENLIICDEKGNIISGHTSNTFKSSQQSINLDFGLMPCGIYFIVIPDKDHHRNIIKIVKE
jgi:chitinase